MKEEISEKTLTMLKVVEGKMLMFSTNLLVVSDVKTEVITTMSRRSIFNKNPKPVNTIYLTGITIKGYSSEGKFMGTMSDYNIMHILQYHDLYTLRDNWTGFKEQLLGFGFEVIPVKK